MIIGFIAGSALKVAASILFKANEIEYNGDKTEKTNVQDALDELYQNTSSESEIIQDYFSTAKVTSYSYSLSGTSGSSWTYTATTPCLLIMNEATYGYVLGNNSNYSSFTGQVNTVNITYGKSNELEDYSHSYTGFTGGNDSIHYVHFYHDTPSFSLFLQPGETAELNIVSYSKWNGSGTASLTYNIVANEE